MSRIISFSLYGSAPLYCEGAIRNLELARAVYPGWRCRFYVDESVPQRYLDALALRGAEILHVGKGPGPSYCRFCRFLPAADPTVERFIVRDTDSRLNVRERAAVEAWILSGKSFHIMRDHPGHNCRVMGGTWGGIGGRLPQMAELIDGWGRFQSGSRDSPFMSEIVFPRMAKDYICHDSQSHFDDGLPFPAHEPLMRTRYVGEVVHVDQPLVDAVLKLSKSLHPSPSAAARTSPLLELMLADEDRERHRRRTPLNRLGRIWAQRRRLPSGFSIRQWLKRN